MIDNVRLSCFITLSSTLNFTKAAQKLYMTQQAISSQIAKLEDELGFPLFVRTTKDVTLTPAGELFFKDVMDLEKKYQDLVNRLREETSARSKVIRIGYLTDLNLHDQMSVLMTSFRAKKPEISFAAEYHSAMPLIERLQEGRLDIIFVYDHHLINTSGLKTQPFLNVPAVIAYVPSARPDGSEPSPASLINERVMFTDHGGSSINESIARIKKHCERVGIFAVRPYIAPNVDSLEAALEMGQGIALCSTQNKMLLNPAIRTVPLGLLFTVLCVCKSDEVKQDVLSFMDHISHNFPEQGDDRLTSQ